MITAIRIKGFRCFHQLSVEGLTRVSLLVGANNAGKTSVLEAAEVVLGSSDPTVLARSPGRRSELTDEPGSARRLSRPVVDHLFHGHRSEPGTSFRIESREGAEEHFLDCTLIAHKARALHRLSHLQAADAADMAYIAVEPMVEYGVDVALPETSLALQLRGDRLAGGRYVLPLLGHALPELVPPAGTAPPPIQFIDTAAPTARRLQTLWNEVVLTPDEEQVTSVLQLIDPNITRIAALSGASCASEGGIFVKLKGVPQRLPLGSMGEGLKRLLALSLSLTGAAGGYLLVDEIDTGLHHSVMVKVWRLVLETAARLDVQVLATTHSLDCIHALAELYEQTPEVRDLISLHRIQRDARQSTPYSADELLAAARHQMELR